MKSREFNGTGRAVSEIGLGCWQLGGDFGPIEEDRAFNVLQAAVDNGIDFFDTADVYGAGRSESFIGDFFQGQANKPFITTKFGRDGSVYPDNYSLDALRRGLEGALERLKVDSLDLIQLHCVPIELLKRGEIFDWLRQVKQDGLIKAFGASIDAIEQAELCLQQPDVSSLQIIFNIFRQKPLQRILPKAKEQNVGIIVRLPLASGLLSGRFTADTQFAASDHRNYNKDGQAFSVGETFAGIPLAKGVELVDELKTLLPDSHNLAAWALRWLLDNDAVTTIIAGASREEQVVNNAQASDLPPLDDATHQRLAEFYAEKVAPHVREDN